jgi:glycosyltransferase involved in cell wall biosynthesis
VHLLVDAFTRLQSTALRDWTLRIIGPWETAQGGGGAEYYARLKSLAAPAESHVALVPPIFDEAQLAQEYRQAGIFCYPSLAEFGETFGLAVLEAMGSGAAPIVSDLACFRDFVRPQQNGLIFDHRRPDSVSALVDELLKLTQDAELRSRLRLAAWTTARSYALPAVAHRYLEDFLTLSANHGAKSCPRRYGFSHP